MHKFFDPLLNLTNFYISYSKNLIKTYVLH